MPRTWARPTHRPTAPRQPLRHFAHVSVKAERAVHDEDDRERSVACRPCHLADEQGSSMFQFDGRQLLQCSFSLGCYMISLTQS